MRYNQSNYRRVYEDKPEEISALVASEEEPSLSEVVQVFSEKFSGKSILIKFSAVAGENAWTGVGFRFRLEVQGGRQ